MREKKDKRDSSFWLGQLGRVEMVFTNMGKIKRVTLGRSFRGSILGMVVITEV